MEKIMGIFKLLLPNEEAKKAEDKYYKLMNAKYELDNAWKIFNEVTESAYIDIAIIKLNLAKKRFEILIEENKREAELLKEAN